MLDLADLSQFNNSQVIQNFGVGDQIEALSAPAFTASWSQGSGAGTLTLTTVSTPTTLAGLNLKGTYIASDFNVSPTGVDQCVRTPSEGQRALPNS